MPLLTKLSYRALYKCSVLTNTIAEVLAVIKRNTALSRQKKTTNKTNND